MAYSNVTPPTLPSYDSVANPYYLIQFEYALGAENWETVRFWYGAAPLTWNGSAVTNAVDFSLYTYGTGSPEWTAWGVMAEAGEMALTPGPTTADTYMRLYTNHDILDGTGAVWLAKGTVTPTEEDKEAEIQIRKKSQLAGIIAAWCAPVRQFPKPTAEPVAFLYGHIAKEGETPTHTINGVDYVGAVLPKLPAGYEYAVIKYGANDDGVMRYSLFMSQEPMTHASRFVAIELYEDVIVAKPKSPDFVLTDGVWDLGYTFESLNRTIDKVKEVFWANHDVLKSDGIVFLQGTDPIPIYE